MAVQCHPRSEVVDFGTKIGNLTSNRIAKFFIESQIEQQMV